MNTTANDVFKYSTYSTTPEALICSVFIQAVEGLGLSWSQIDQILQGLMQFSSGAGIDRQVHFQDLQLDVSFSNEGRIGVGLLWCTSVRGRATDEVEERAGIPFAGHDLDRRLSLVPKLANETSESPNESLLMTDPANQISFPVLGTNIVLAFVWLGYPLPSQNINNIVQSAFLRIIPFLKESPNQPIPRDRFLHTDQTGKIPIAIQIYGSLHLTWSELNSVMLGLHRFTKGIGTPHSQTYFRNLGFDIKDESGATIGFGNLLRLAAAINTTTTISSEKRSTLPINSTIAYIYPIPGTTITLLFNYIGDPLPDSSVVAAIRAAFFRIQPAILTIPDSPIHFGRFEQRIGGVLVIVDAYEGSEISWRQLGTVLRGLEQVCAVPFYRRHMAFDIEEEGRGRIAAGKVWGIDGNGGGGTGLVRVE